MGLLTPVVGPIVSLVDVDGVVQKIDLNKLLSRIDPNDLIDRIDLNRHLLRVDWNKVMDKVDINRILDRFDIEAIVARSSSSVWSNILDSVRAKIVLLDQGFQRNGQVSCFGKEICLPPKPGVRRNSEGNIPFPAKRSELILQVQGRYCGILSRTCALLIDFLVMWALLIFVVLIVETIIYLIEGKTPVIHVRAFRDMKLYWCFVVIYGWFLFYTIITLHSFGHTVGMGLLGLTLVKVNGTRCSFQRICARQLVDGICSIAVGVQLMFAVVAWLRLDGRTPTDMIFCTGFVFAWDARMAKLRNPKLLRSVDTSSSTQTDESV